MITYTMGIITVIMCSLVWSSYYAPRFVKVAMVLPFMTAILLMYMKGVGYGV